MFLLLEAYFNRPSTSNHPDIDFLQYAASNKVLIIGNAEINDEESLSWNGNIALYAITQDELSQIGPIQLELDEYVGEGIYTEDN